MAASMWWVNSKLNAIRTKIEMIQERKRVMAYGAQAETSGSLGSGHVEGRYEEEGDTMVATVEYPKSCKITPKKADSKTEEYLKEYAELAALIGVTPPDLTIENLKNFLHKNDIPIFNLNEVVKYMDAKARKESKDRAGWEWRPLREKDHRLNVSFGTRSTASDWYHGPTEQIYFRGSGGGEPVKEVKKPIQSVYDRTVPLHALRKVALIEKEFGDTVGFFVCDYALAPQIEYPDPFLMVVVSNPKINIGEGRFVIDFWSEPGFGIKQMLA